MNGTDLLLFGLAIYLIGVMTGALLAPMVGIN